jgi:hypothetical protein
MGNRLFLNLPADGILVLNVPNPAKRYGQQSMRALGYANGRSQLALE